MNPISAWLYSHRPYDEGVQLYLQYGTDPLLKNLFREAYSPFKEKKLAQVLELLSGVPETIQPPAISPQEVPTVIPAQPGNWPAYKDEVLTSLHAGWLPLFAEKKNLQSRLYDIAKAGHTEETGRMAHRILDLRDACRAIYQQRDYYLQHGKLPEAPQPLKLPVNPLQYPKTLANYERYIREYKYLLAKNPAHKTAQAQIDKYTWGITELKKRMGISDVV